MGLNFSYQLYFRREDMWKALQGVVDVAVDHQAQTRIIFPDHEITIPLINDHWNKREFHHDDPEFNFATSLYFEVDDAINDYLLHLGNEEVFRGPPDTDGIERVSIGFIYLVVYQKKFIESLRDWVLFDFGTTGTRMSMLFDESLSIRKTFINLLEKNQGVSGIFSREFDGGELFWFNAQQYSIEIGNAYQLPDEIEKSLKRGWF